MTSSIASFYWLMGILGLPVFVGGLAWLWIAVVRGLRRREPGCGDCGYSVLELESSTCPECGSDLLDVGIVGRFRPFMRPWVFLLLWTILLAFPMRSVTIQVVSRAPLYVWKGYAINLAPHSGVGRTITVSMETNARMPGRAGLPGLPGANTIAAGTAEAPTATISLPPVASQAAGAPVIAKVSGFAADGNESMRELGTAPYAAADVRDWLGTLAPDASSDVLDADAEEITAMLNAWNTTGTFTTTRYGMAGGAGLGPGPPSVASWLMPTIFGSWIALWALGAIVYFALRRRRPMPAARQAGAA